MHILRHMAAAQAPEAGPPRACMLFSFFFFYSGSCWIHLSRSFCRLLSISNTTYVCLKMCTRSFRGGATGARPRPRFPGLARLNHAQQLQRSPASSQLSKISREDPPPLRGGRRHQLTCRQFHGIIWTIVSWRFVACSFVFFLWVITRMQRSCM